MSTTWSEESIAVYRRTFQERLKRQQEQRESVRKRALEEAYAHAPVVIAGYPSVRRAYLFGSVIHSGTFRAQSDIDIAVEGITATAYFALWRALEQALPDWTIDLRDITSPSRFADLVRRIGIVIYERTDSPSPG